MSPPVPASVASSPSLGVSTSPNASVAGCRPLAGAGLRIVVAPASRPSRSASCVAPVRISCPTSTTSSGVSDNRLSASRTCTDVSIAFAPPATAIVFSPAASTVISATPVACPASSATGTVDGLSLEGRASLTTERVVPDRAHEHSRNPEAGSRDRLVAALATVMAIEPSAGDGFAGSGKTLDGHHEVHVDRADDDDPTAHGDEINAGGRASPAAS